MKGTALVTGASGGIGLELARRLARAGHDLILVARSGAKLEALAREVEREHGVQAMVLVQDLTDPAAPQAIYDAVQAAGLDVAVLVNNAGFATNGDFAGSDLTTQLDMVQVNVTTLTHLTRLFLPGMVSQGRGRIMNVASTAAFQPGPKMAVYFATKAYVLSLSEALSYELRKTGVTVTALCPGATDTGFAARAEMGSTVLFKRAMDAATVAEIGYRAMMAGRPVAVVGRLNAFMVASVRFLPRRLAAALAGMLTAAGEA